MLPLAGLAYKISFAVIQSSSCAFELLLGSLGTGSKALTPPITNDVSLLTSPCVRLSAFDGDDASALPTSATGRPQTGHTVSPHSEMVVLQRKLQKNGVFL